MADTLAILGQVNSTTLGANTTGTLCTGTTNGTTVSSIVVCNTNAAAITFQIWLRIGAAADSALTQAIYYNMTLGGNDTFIATVGITMATTDNVRVQANTTAVVFSAFGVNT